ncbi:alanine racemase [Convivina intestini]|uniref:alanine racemase n=1 Tax=Convivina intestini TaxID=1505726 RepID=UPI00200C6A6D|nr:alanine racemase [Convivina intestini]CAH1855768.1 Alanine racemase [Convivina intestini]
MKQEERLKLRPTWLEVDLSAIQANAQAIMQTTGAKRLIAVVKANAYGHGAVRVGQALYDIGVKDFAVATVGEGIELRQGLVATDIKISLLGVQPAEYADVMAQYHLQPAVGDLDWLKLAKSHLNPGQVLGVQLAVDTGMGRMGVESLSELQELYSYIEADASLYLAGVFTHFATADDLNQNYYDSQLQKFMSWVQSAGIPEEYWHLANSGSALFHAQQIPTHTIRVGSVLYGYNPGAPLLTSPIALKPAASLYSKIGAVHQLQAGQSVSYGATYQAEHPQWVATLPIGYADGYNRRLGGMNVLVNGQVEQVIGRVTMDQIIITLHQREPVGTPVVLLGKSGQNQITIEALADYAETIPHELLTGFSARVPRCYRS